MVAFVAYIFYMFLQKQPNFTDLFTLTFTDGRASLSYPGLDLQEMLGIYTNTIKFCTYIIYTKRFNLAHFSIQIAFLWFKCPPPPLTECLGLEGYFEVYWIVTTNILKDE